MAKWTGVQGQEKVAKKKRKHPYLQQSPQRTLNRKWKLFFFDFKQKTCWIQGWFGELSSSIGWRVIALQTRAKSLAGAGLKGLNIVTLWVTGTSGQMTSLFLITVISYCFVLMQVLTHTVTEWQSSNKTDHLIVLILAVRCRNILNQFRPNY